MGQLCDRHRGECVGHGEGDDYNRAIAFNGRNATAGGVAVAGGGDCGCQGGYDNANNAASADGAGSQAYAGFGAERNIGNKATATGGGYAQAGSQGNDLVDFVAVAGAGEIVIEP